MTFCLKVEIFGMPVLFQIVTLTLGSESSVFDTKTSAGNTRGLRGSSVFVVMGCVVSLVDFAI